MKADKINVLCTGVLEPDFVEKALQMGIWIDVKPFIKVNSTVTDLMGAQITKLSKNHALGVFTSVQAVRAIQTWIIAECPWQIACIEGKTSETAGDLFGATNILITGEDAHDLAFKIAETKIKIPVHFFCGNQRLETLPEILKESGINMTEGWCIKPMQHL